MNDNDDDDDDNNNNDDGGDDDDDDDDYDANETMQMRLAHIINFSELKINANVVAFVNKQQRLALR